MKTSAWGFMALSQKVALANGSSSGIGHEISFDSLQGITLQRIATNEKPWEKVQIWKPLRKTKTTFCILSWCVTDETSL